MENNNKNKAKKVKKKPEQTLLTSEIYKRISEAKQAEILRYKDVQNISNANIKAKKAEIKSLKCELKQTKHKLTLSRRALRREQRTLKLANKGLRMEQRLNIEINQEFYKAEPTYIVLSDYIEEPEIKRR